MNIVCDQSHTIIYVWIWEMKQKQLNLEHPIIQQYLCSRHLQKR